MYTKFGKIKLIPIFAGAQAVQKDGGSREDVDIQYGDNSIEIRLKDDQPPEKQGLCNYH